MMDDKALRRTLIDVLDGEPSINAAQIGVAVENGIVTLKGRVKSPAEKVTAERAVRRVKGVRAVVPSLAICGTGKKASDDEIARRARVGIDRKSTRLNSSHANISYAVFCLKKKPVTARYDMPMLCPK